MKGVIHCGSRVEILTGPKKGQIAVVVDFEGTLNGTAIIEPAEPADWDRGAISKWDLKLTEDQPKSFNRWVWPDRSEDQSADGPAKTKRPSVTDGSILSPGGLEVRFCTIQNSSIQSARRIALREILSHFRSVESTLRAELEEYKSIIR